MKTRYVIAGLVALGGLATALLMFRGASKAPSVSSIREPTARELSGQASKESGASSGSQGTRQSELPIQRGSNHVQMSPAVPVPHVSTHTNLLRDMKTAIAVHATNDVAALLKTLRENPAAHAAAIIALAQDNSVLPAIRALMLKLMGGLRDDESLVALVALSETLSDPMLRAESVKALGNRPEHEAEARLRVIADDPQDPARAMATSLLGTGSTRESQDLLASQLTDPASSPELRNAALYAMRRYDDQATVAALMQTANDPSASARERATALYSLGVIGNSNALPVVKANLNSQDREVRYSAALAATRVSDATVSASLVTSLCDIDNFPHVRKAASAALVRNATATDLETLRLQTQNTDGFGIRLACDVFAAKRDESAIPILQSLSGKVSDLYVRQHIEQAVESIKRGEP